MVWTLGPRRPCSPSFHSAPIALEAVLSILREWVRSTEILVRYCKRRPVGAASLADALCAVSDLLPMLIDSGQADLHSSHARLRQLLGHFT